ncbi:type I-E CRISPR-associated protein Cse1/CasA [Rothia terrae]|uniref:type I-E CRISPR-associated protein Cse1/CasA n=1 Tax=Rothia terrae TaxID=396015 RepID=UPI0028827E47|nr:type I-E CRISPR-associated protein Cse1/CasA [Rothia terrae]MDT0189636.1 type I-E CRISPR-associated protein Cse1/CasA [Rothia terrae]
MEQTGKALPDFNLVERPWIRVQTQDGSLKELSLEELFSEGYTVHRLSHDDALIDTAVLAVLEAIFIRANLRYVTGNGGDKFLDEDRFNTKAWVQHMLTEQPSNLEPVIDYLNDENIKTRFNLFHPEHPFMQVADLHTEKGAFSNISRIIFDSESDHFSIRADKGKQSLSLGEAARYLIATHGYDYSGIKSGAVGDTRVKGGKGYPIGTGWHGATGKVLLHGKNIVETLLLNMPFGESFALNEDGYFTAYETDLPVWERSPDTAAQREPDQETVQPTGVCDVLTWQSRRIRLFPHNNEVTGVLVSNGDKIPDKFVDATNRFDPWTGYRYSKNQSKKNLEIWMPLQHSPERTLWRGVEAFIAQTTAKGEEKAPIKPATFTGLRYFPEKNHLSVQLVGVVYGTQNSVIETVIDETLPIELALLTEKYEKQKAAITENAAKSVEASVRLGSFSGRLLVAAGKEYIFQASATESALHRLEQEYKRWLRTITHESKPEDLKKSWQIAANNFLRAEANHLVAVAPPRVQVGRFQRNNNEESLISAATVHRSLVKSLKNIFPLAYPVPRKEKDNEQQ